MTNNEVLTAPILLIALKQMGVTLDAIDGQLNINSGTLREIQRSLKNVNISCWIKDDILDSKALKRRLNRVQIITGNKTNMVTKWERSLFSALKMNRRDIIKGWKDWKCNTTLWDALDAIPEYKRVGVEILKDLERKYKIPEAMYSVEQVKEIAALRREFDCSTIMAMNNLEFHRWLDHRFMEVETMFDGEPFSGRRIVYTLLALSCPEFVPEKVIKYIDHQELVNILDRVMEEENSTNQKFRYKSLYYPLSDRKIELDSIKGRFVDIILRCLIV